MSLYFLTFLLLAAGVLLAWFKPQLDKKIYWGCWVVMTVCLCFRFGQGTDYVTYHAIYKSIPAVVNLSKGYICGFYPEIGWRMLSAVFKYFHAPFQVFVMVLGLTEMFLLHWYLKKYIPERTMGLFMLYPVLFLTYMVSGLRQGLAVCVFLGILVPFYMGKKWICYVLGVIVASSFHRVGFGWLILPFIYYVPTNILLGLTGLAMAGGIFLQMEAVQGFLLNLVPIYHLEQFLLEGEISYFAMGERLLSFSMILLLYFRHKRNGQILEKRAELLLKAYMCGVCTYVLLFGSSYYASRYCVIFKVLEGAVLLLLIQKKEWLSKFVLLFFFGLTLLMGCKNLNAMIREAYCYDVSTVNIWNFPYISVFNQDKILEYMSYEDRLEEIYGYNIEDQKLWILEE